MVQYQVVDTASEIPIPQFVQNPQFMQNPPLYLQNHAHSASVPIALPTVLQSYVHHSDNMLNNQLQGSAYQVVGLLPQPSHQCSITPHLGTCTLVPVVTTICWKQETTLTA